MLGVLVLFKFKVTASQIENTGSMRLVEFIGLLVAVECTGVGTGLFLIQNNSLVIPKVRVHVSLSASTFHSRLLCSFICSSFRDRPVLSRVQSSTCQDLGRHLRRLALFKHHTTILRVQFGFS
jgi:hypothetical protein